MLTPVCLRLTYIQMSKVIMDGWWDDIIYLVGHLCRASSRPMWKCLCVKEVKAANGEALEGQDPAGLGTTGVEAVDWFWTLAGPIILRDRIRGSLGQVATYDRWESFVLVLGAFPWH